MQAVFHRSVTDSGVQVTTWSQLWIEDCRGWSLAGMDFLPAVPDISTVTSSMKFAKY